SRHIVPESLHPVCGVQVNVSAYFRPTVAICVFDCLFSGRRAQGLLCFVDIQGGHSDRPRLRRARASSGEARSEYRLEEAPATEASASRLAATWITRLASL